jgi:hypothetical protein
VQATDTAGRSASATIQLLVSAVLTITSTSLPNALVGVPYSTQLQATGGSAPYAWAVTQGQLPTGLALNSTGVVSGTPTTAGSYTLTVQVTDAVGAQSGQSITVTVAPPPSVSSAPALGIYGGLYNTIASTGSTGHFGLTKAGNRWFLKDPQAHLFFGLQVYEVSTGTAAYQTSVLNKYGSIAQWRAVQPGRIQKMGFNSLADDLDPNLTGINGGLPFSRMVNGSDYAMRSPAAGGTGVKNVYAGIGNYSGYIGEAPDVYDPAFAASYAGSASYDQYGVNVLPNTPWLIAVTTDDADYTFGVKDAPGPGCGNSHYNSAFMVARSNPVVTKYIGPNSNHAQTYADTKLYTKYAWRDYLKGLPQYQTSGSPDITKLNAAWGSTYTTWDCTTMSGSVCAASSWGNGTGLLDENGTYGSAWMGTDEFGLSNANPNFATDANNFLYQMWRKYAVITADAIRAYVPTALVFSPASLGACTRPQILKAFTSDDPAKPGHPLFDVLEIGTVWSTDYSKLTSIYDQTGTPMVLWDTHIANADSSMSTSSCTAWGALCSATQAQRGAAYAAEVASVANVQGTNGDYPIIGIRWWQWNDNPAENMNFGLVSLKDNAYDGIENVSSATPCDTTTGYTCGGEPAVYGNFLGPVTTANNTLLKAFESAYWSPAPEGTNKALSKPVTVSSTWSSSCPGACVGLQGVDGDSTTRWSSLATDGEWYQVDLVNTYNLTSVSIEWSVASPAAYNLLVSADGVNWTTVARRTGLAAMTDHQILTDTFAATPARYLKFQGVSRASAWGYSFYELTALQ